MGDNNEQEEADLAAMNADDDDDDNLFEVRYLGGRLDNYYNAENPRPRAVPDYIIPDDVNIRLVIDASVTKIDNDACCNCRMLREVVFHNKVTEIGSHAFGACSNLLFVVLHKGLLRLERDAFEGCDSLRGEIVIPASVQYMGDAVFRGCTSLESVVFVPTPNMIPASVQYMASAIFAECTSLESVVFVPTPNMVELGSKMFSHCTNLRFVALPQNLRSIPAWFFSYCISLTRLQIPVFVTEIGGDAFSGSGIQATKISEEDEFMPGTLILPPNLHSIPRSCFKDCKSLTHIRIHPSVEEIDASAFDGSALRSITIPETVHWIGREALRNCSSLKEVTFHSSSHLNMADDIFANCPALSVIKMDALMWPKLFTSMNGQPDFIIKFFREYHTKIFKFNDWWVNRVVMHDNDNEE